MVPTPVGAVIPALNLLQCETTSLGQEELGEQNLHDIQGGQYPEDAVDPD